MLTPFTHVATALSVFVSAQLALPSVSRIWVSEPEHRCSSPAHDRWSDKAPAPRKAKATGGRSASPSIQIVTFGP